MISKINDSRTPLGITGVIPTKENGRKAAPDLYFRIDWLQGTFPNKYLDKVKKYVDLLLGKGNFRQHSEKERKEILKEAGKADFGFVERAYGIRYFNRSYVHPSGALIATGRKLPSGEIDESISYLELSGAVCCQVRQSKLRKFMITVRKRVELHPTRLDPCIDDFAKTLDINQIRRAADKHHYLGFGDTVKYHAHGRKGSKGKGISFGRRGSAGGGKYLVIYDKAAQSKGLIDSIRIELSCYKHYAEQLFDQLCDLPYCHWGELIRNWIFGAIDFRARRGKEDKNPGRRKRLSWWAKIMKNAVPMKPGRLYKPPSIQSLKAWLKHQVSPSLVVLKERNEVQFWAFILEMIKDGETRLREKHRWLIALE